MTHQEIRLRCLEAINSTGVRDPHRVIKDAKVLEEWVMAADNGKAPVGRPKKITG